MSVPAAPRFTYDDYAVFPEDRRYEVIDGALFVTPAPTPFHQVVKGRIKRVLEEFIESRGLGTVLDAPCDVVLSPNDVFQPDVLYVSTAQRAIIGENFIAGAPDLVVEVLSPSTQSRDRIAKVRRYATFGVREMWLADPVAKTIEVLVNEIDGPRQHDLFGKGDTVRSIVLPELTFPVAPIFWPI